MQEKDKIKETAYTVGRCVAIAPASRVYSYVLLRDRYVSTRVLKSKKYLTTINKNVRLVCSRHFRNLP